MVQEFKIRLSAFSVKIRNYIYSKTSFSEIKNNPSTGLLFYKIESGLELDALAGEELAEG